MDDAIAIDPTVSEVANTIQKIDDDNIKNINDPMYFAHVNVLIYHQNHLNSAGYKKNKIIVDKKIKEFNNKKRYGFDKTKFFTNFNGLDDDDKVYVFNTLLKYIGRNRDFVIEIIKNDKSNILLYYSDVNNVFWNNKIIKPILENAKAVAKKKAEDATTKAVVDTTTKVVDTLPSDDELAKELAELAHIQKGTSFVDGEEKDESEDDKSDDEEKQDESIKINLKIMLTKLPPYTAEKTEEQYRREYIAVNNKDGELFTYEEEKEDGVHSVGGRTQKKKKKRVQNRRRQKTIKNKV